MPKILSDDVIHPAPGSPSPKGMLTILKRVVEEDSGHVREQYIWQRGSFVSVAVVNHSKKLLLKKEFKYGAMQEFLTFAAGGVKKGETPENAARRELMEEFGKEAEILTLLAGDLSNSPDKSTERQFIFLAQVGERTELHEAGEILKVPLVEARELLGDPRMRSLIQRLTLHEVLSAYRL